MSESKDIFRTQKKAFAFLQSVGIEISKREFSDSIYNGEVKKNLKGCYDKCDIIAYAEKIKNLQDQIPVEIKKLRKIKPVFVELFKILWPYIGNTINAHQELRAWKEHAYPLIHMDGYDNDLAQIYHAVQMKLDSPESPEPVVEIPTRLVDPSLSDPTNQLIGIALALIYSGSIVKRDVYFLSRWLDEHKILCQDNVVYDLLIQVRKSIGLDLELRENLVPVYKRLCNVIHHYGLVVPNFKIKCKPPDIHERENPAHILIPKDHEMFDHVEYIDFSAVFCFTGVFAFGERASCETAVSNLGGIVKKHPVKTGKCYLIVGTLSNPRWSLAEAGQKIEDAKLDRQFGCDTFIIHEDDWTEALTRKQLENI